MNGGINADCAIVGGGAAGLAAAIFLARQSTSRRIVLLDGAKKLGAKILISGGGRCNVTNDVVAPHDFWGGSRNVIRRVLEAFPVSDTIEFFREIGVQLHEEPGGKLFPNSNKARTVLDALLNEAHRTGVQILCDHRVSQIERQGDQFCLTTAQPVSAPRVILATGGRSVPKTGSDGWGYRIAESLGHTIVPPMPALVALILDGEFHRSLAGVSQEVQLTVAVDRERPLRLRGALLWTHFGISGPVVLNASRHWHAAKSSNREIRISISFLPDNDLASAERMFIDWSNRQPRTALHNALSLSLPHRVAIAVLSELRIDAQVLMGQLERETRRKLAQALLSWPVLVRDSRGFQYAEVTAGGVALGEIHPATMESRICPGLYLIGEILDVDGRIGGFNFQWAWSSAWVAGTAIGRLASHRSPRSSRGDGEGARE